MKKIIALIPFLFLIFACTDSELIIEGENVGGGSTASTTTTNCDDLTFVDQDAKGVFTGTNYTYQKAYYTHFQVGGVNNYRMKILINTPTGGSCTFPEYGEGQANQSILFSINNLETQTIEFQETGSSTLNFNSINGNVTNIELATCGTFELVSYDSDAGKVYGKITGKGQQGSTINGKVTFELCENN